MPSSLHIRRRNLSGVRTRMPAPSPELGSQPQAPRCDMFSSMSRASSTILCEALPLMWQRKPTPQESCSKRGSYRPCAGGKPRIMMLVQCPSGQKCVRMVRIDKYTDGCIVGQDFLRGQDAWNGSWEAHFLWGNRLGWDGFWLVLLNARMHGWSTPLRPPGNANAGE